ncbi:conserved exported hypothetical protein [Pseudomonas sp. 8AS]|uniref:tetratricopeptide repeat protein n=1 Tax=Pseudomonas sp. 8AS TaxID=2653163 RepID=UPI0012F20F17|nr:tetratricopeptide repeat protein [Pseudomonas sp. 8AS]VXC47800.1 conserved exported hypothetical protein [Pseudomonas sp. 8AS]
MQYPRHLPRLLASLALLGSLGAGSAWASTCTIVVDPSDAPAVEALKAKAAVGDACAQFNLGYVYYTRQAYPLSELWYAQAADQGVARAAFELAILYRDELLPGGDGKRLPLLEQAANQGLDLAQVELGVDYLLQGDDSQQQFIAMQWFEKAAVQGNTHAQYLLAEEYWSDDNGIQDIGSDDGLAERYVSNDDKALQWLCKAALGGYAQAQYGLSHAYSIGRGMPSNQVQRRLWLEKAAASGSQEAIAELDSSDSAWYTRAEQWLKRQTVSEEARCPDVALALEQ